VLADLADASPIPIRQYSSPIPAARLLTCWVPDSVLRRKMDDVRSEPGYRFDEESHGNQCRRHRTGRGPSHRDRGRRALHELMHDAACVAVPITTR